MRSHFIEKRSDQFPEITFQDIWEENCPGVAEEVWAGCSPAPIHSSNSLVLKGAHLGLYWGPWGPKSLPPPPPRQGAVEAPGWAEGVTQNIQAATLTARLSSRRKWELLHSTGCHFVKTATAVIPRTNLSPKNDTGSLEFSLRSRIKSCCPVFRIR